MRRRLQSESGYLTELFFYACIGVVMAIFVLGLLRKGFDSSDSHGAPEVEVVVQKSHAQEQLTSEFVINDDPVDEKEEYVLYLDTNDDKKWDKDVIVEKDIYDQYSLGDEFDSSKPEAGEDK